MNTKLGGTVEVLEARTADQKDFWRRFNKLLDRKFMKSKEHKCRVLHLAQNATKQCKMGTDWLESSSVEEDLGYEKLNMSQQ